MKIQLLQDECIRCMRCVQDCISGVFRESDGSPVAFSPDLCNLCGHCIAVCPVDAIEHSEIDLSENRKVRHGKIKPDVYKEIVYSRRSVRQYKEKSVSSKLIRRIIELASHSPTASNMQNVEYIVVRDKELIQKISRRIFTIGYRIYQMADSFVGRQIMARFERVTTVQTLQRYLPVMEYYRHLTEDGSDLILHGAPAVVLITAPSRANFNCDNANIAATNIINYAHSLGLGTCFIGFLTKALNYDRTLRKWLYLKKGREVFASLVMGYPVYGYCRIARRKPADITFIS